MSKKDSWLDRLYRSGGVFRKDEEIIIKTTSEERERYKMLRSRDSLSKNRGSKEEMVGERE